MGPRTFSAANGERDQTSILRPWATIVLLAGLLLALYLTTPYFSLLEDETSIVSAANAPISKTLAAFTTGVGQHEHPPLSDILLHFWLPMAKVDPALLRLPSEIFYVLGLLVVAIIARTLAGARAFDLSLIIGALWPFGFHFGRLVGWYSFCFLLISLLTLAYVKFLEKNSWTRFWTVAGLAYAAVLTNYFSWAVVGLIAVDLLFFADGIEKRSKYLASGTAALATGYFPVWIAFFYELRHHPANIEGTRGALSTAVRGAFNFYSLFVSESIAPWYFAISVPVIILIAVVMVCTFRQSLGLTSRMLIGFCMLFSVLAVLGVVETKRTLFISGWLLVTIACALASRDKPAVQRLLAVSLILIAAVGWIGIVVRKYYAAPHFLEPWQSVAEQAAAQIQAHRTVISNSPSFLFYLNSVLYERSIGGSEIPHWVEDPRVVSLMPGFQMPEKLKGKFEMVRGTNTVPAAERDTKAVELLLQSSCTLESTQRLVPDNGFAWKKKFFKSETNDPYRIAIEQFDCGSGTGEQRESNR